MERHTGRCIGQSRIRALWWDEEDITVLLRRVCYSNLGLLTSRLSQVTFLDYHSLYITEIMESGWRVRKTSEIKRGKQQRWSIYGWALVWAL